MRPPKSAEPPSKQACNSRPQRPSPTTNRAAIAHQSRHRSRPDASRSSACAFRVSQIPIAEARGLSAHHRPRVRSLAAFGRRAPCTWLVHHGRHPKPCTKAAVSNRSKLALVYSITSSARASSVGGTSRPSALAVLRLITSSNLVGCLHRQVGRLLAFEDAIDVAGAGPILVRKIRPIGDQTTVRAKFAENVNGGQAVPGGQRDDQIAMRPRRHARWDDQAAIRTRAQMQ